MTRRGRGSFGTDVLASVGGNLASPAIGIITAPVLAQALGVTGRGEFAAATSPTLLLTLAGTIGLPEAVTYFVASSRLAPRTALLRGAALSVLVGVLLAGLTALAAPAITTGRDEVTTLIALGALSLPAALALGAVRACAGGLGRWGLVNAEKLVGNGLRLLAVVGCALADVLSLQVAVAIYLLAPVAAVVVYATFLREVWRSRGPVDDRPSLLLVRYGSSTWIGSLTGVVLARVDQVLLAPLAGARQLGLYAAAVAIGEIPYVVSGATRDVLMAADAARADDALAARASRLTLLATGLFALVLGLLADPLVRLAFGDDFARAVPILQVLLLAAVVFTPGDTAGALLLARGRPAARSAGLALACVLNLALLPPLVLLSGGIGAAWASVIAYAAFSTVNLVLLRRISTLTLSDVLVPRRSDLTLIRRLLGRTLVALRDR